MQEIKTFIGKKIRSLREENQLTQANLADFLKCSPMAISHYEKGIRELKMSDLGKLAEKFGKKISYFFPEEQTLFRAENQHNSDIQNSLNDFDNFINK